MTNRRKEHFKNCYIFQEQCPLERLSFIRLSMTMPFPRGNSHNVVIAVKNYKGREPAYALLGLDIK